MADGYLIDETEYSNGKEEEEDPILVAQRYLNIFHQIHIFNAAKKAEFDQSLLSMPEKIKELMATIPGGRVLLEHVQEIEEKKGLSSGETSELISQNLKEEKKALTQQKPSSGGELTLGADFAESLASSLATALQNNNVAANGNITDLAIILNKSFNAYATSMQNLTASLMRRGGDISAGNIPPVSPAPDAPVAAQQNMQNNNSTTVNNINFDSSYFNSITQALMQNDARRHEDMMQIVSALNKSLVPAGTFSAATPVVTNNATSDVPTLAIANSVTEALRQNNSQQMELIKAFGEMLVQAITQSQQELAQTIAQSAPRHVVKVVVSQDVDVENQTAENIVSKPIENKNNTPKNPPKKDEDTKEKTNFVKNFSDKINETTSKLSKNLNASNKPSGGNNNASSDSLLNRINKSLNKINELRKQTDKNAQEQEKQPQPKPEPKPEQKPQPQPQPRPEPKPEQKTQPQPRPEPKPEQKTQPQPRPEPKPEQKAQPQPKPEPKPEQKPQPQPKPEPKPEQKPQPQPRPEPKPEQKPQPQPKPEPKPEQKPQPQPRPEPKPEPKNEKFLDIDDILADIPVESALPLTDTPDIYSDNSFSAPDILSSTPKTSEPAVKPAGMSQNIPSPATTESEKNKVPEYKKSQLHSYEDALLKIKNALNSDDDISVNNLDIKPVSLGGADEQLFFQNEPNTKVSTTPQNNDRKYTDENNNSAPAGDDDWEYVDENGNPVPADEDGDWEYVDENGNPVSADEDGDWEYVDENGNPVSADEDGDWEYVDENGNPVPADEDDDWEYVDENGNPLSNNK